MAYGGSIPGTNLLIVTVQRQQGGPGALKSLSEVGRLRVCDEFGNRSEECSSTPFSGPPGVVGQLWIVSAFPRRTRTITLECLATNVQGGWLKIAEFRVPNPAWANYPKWKPEAMPVTKLDGGLAVTLETFQSGWRMPAPGGLGDAATAARKTRLVLSFLENGRPCSDWAIKHLVCIDATGNRCFGFPDAAYLDPGRAAFDIYRPLWPGEQAWKVRAEFSRVAGFTPLDLWQVSFNLPGPGTVSRLTNAGTHNGVALKLAVVASPHVELGSPFVSVGQKEPDDSENFYALGLQFEGPFADRWVNILRMTDEHGVQLSLTGGLSNLSPTKKLFFKPGIGVKSVKLTMAVPIDRVVEFMARPQLVDDMTAVAIE